jgi:hypothetical protein
MRGKGKVIVPAVGCLLCRVTTPFAVGATSTQFPVEVL